MEISTNNFSICSTLKVMQTFFKFTDASKLFSRHASPSEGYNDNDGGESSTESADGSGAIHD